MNTTHALPERAELTSTVVSKYSSPVASAISLCSRPRPRARDMSGANDVALDETSRHQSPSRMLNCNSAPSGLKWRKAQVSSGALDSMPVFTWNTAHCHPLKDAPTAHKELLNLSICSEV